MLPRPTVLSDLTRPAMGADDVLDDGQAQAGPAEFAAACLVDAVEAFEQAAAGVWRRCRTLRPGRGSRPDRLRWRPRRGQPRGRAVLDRVVDQVDDGLFDERRIGPDHQVVRAGQFAA